MVTRAIAETADKQIQITCDADFLETGAGSVGVDPPSLSKGSRKAVKGRESLFLAPSLHWEQTLECP